MRGWQPAQRAWRSVKTYCKARGVGWGGVGKVGGMHSAGNEQPSPLAARAPTSLLVKPILNVPRIRTPSSTAQPPLTRANLAPGPGTAVAPAEVGPIAADSDSDSGLAAAAGVVKVRTLAPALRWLACTRPTTRSV